MDILKDIISSPKFLAWLEQENITLALSTYQTNRLFLIRTQERAKPALVHKMFPHVMGLYSTGNSLWMSTKIEVVRLKNILDESDRTESTKLYLPRAKYATGDLDIHDLVVAGDRL